MDLGLLKRKLRKDNPRWVILFIDIIIVLGCYVVSSYVVNSFSGNFDVLLMMKKSLLVLSAYAFAFLYMRTYRDIVRHTGLSEAIRIAKTVWLACMLIFVISFVVRQTVEKGTPPSDYLRQSYALTFTHGFFTMVMLVAARVVYRQLYEMLFFTKRKSRHVLIFGASRPGLVAYAMLHDDIRAKNKVLAFVEDKANRVGKNSRGIRILHISDIDAEYVRQHDVDEVIIAVENNDPERLARLTDHFQQLPLELKIMQPGRSLLNGGGRRQIRKLQIEDLLGRKPIRLDNPIVQQELKDRCILVTGAAGSIGSELARQVASMPYARLILLDQAESPLYDLQQTIHLYDPKASHFVVGDVRDKIFMRRIFEKYRPEVIFHAAAYKHVPLMEENPYEAIWTNVYGSRIMADLAIEFETYKFVMISTDKAVNPTNVMGATKRAAEIYINGCNLQEATNFIITRFGNVLGSNGSVIPLFEKQMERGGPLTLTHPDITRYFMTIPEACQLVLEAGTMGKGGEIFVFDMGKSVKIIDLAKRMIKLKGYRFPEDIDIKIVGLRPGEKIYEELLANNENTQKTHHPKIMIAKVSTNDLLEKRQQIELMCDYVATEHLPLEKPELEVVRQLKLIVPEFLSQNSAFAALDQAPIDSADA
ncbi:nucleoside-diphosphate sugar epimerase/dehydratase [Sphingobacterium oryzagri]|uniref:Nucleoside-diphosphate sugar epimerase/dehydratase n=1 Tax=Sphingobacterium oryzagri TaxID=3025669 RepID=A0ABY7WJF8_9SPHI|nr:nucleoside-diphosphate sugar epimerase/dehydratase [Sphingobacterium sp. KACC 22765]WDF69120.1 nucleoside-diphosphate sugar epimerase/dehydratase [Sphingobacterium sp. KACC 22765]